MPKGIEQNLMRIQQNFIWNGSKSTPVGAETLSQPLARGGKSLLDIPARNQAIEAMMLKSYLATKIRPRWAYVADDILRKNISHQKGVVKESTTVNPFLQHWNPKLHEGTTTVPMSL